MNRRDFLRGLLGGVAVLTLPQVEAIKRQLEPKYLLEFPKHFDKIPVRTELTVLPADDPKARDIGFYIEEVIGIAVVSTSTPEERTERAARHQAWLDSLPEDYDPSQHIHLCSSGSMYSGIPISSTGSITAATKADLPTNAAEQTVCHVVDQGARFVQVDGVGWVQLA